jgi:hypothetical protein
MFLFEQSYFWCTLYLAHQQTTTTTRPTTHHYHHDEVRKNGIPYALGLTQSTYCRNFLVNRNPDATSGGGPAPSAIEKTAATLTDQLPVAFPGTLAPANNVPALLRVADAILVVFVVVWRHRRLLRCRCRCRCLLRRCRPRSPCHRRPCRRRRRPHCHSHHVPHR